MIKIDLLKIMNKKRRIMKNTIKKIQGIIKKCRWCGKEFNTENSEHKNLCSDGCFHAEKIIQ